MSIRLYNAKIMRSPYDEIFEGEILIDGRFIKKISRIPDSGNYADVNIDCHNNLVMSGFCNNHTHSPMTLFRNLADDVPLQDWLYDKIFPLENKLTEEDAYYATLLQILEFVRGGITAFSDMYFFDDSVAKAASLSGLACNLCGGLNDLHLSSDRVLSKIRNSYYKYNNGYKRLVYTVGVHAEYTCSDKLLESVADFANETSSKTYIHASETLKEVGDCTVKRNGLTPIEYLHKIGYFDNGGCVAHCTNIDKEEMALLKEKSIYPVINCSSNLKLASGIPPIYTMLKNGLKLTLGTDGMASNNSASMFKEMFLFCALPKAIMKDAAAVSAEVALTAATFNGYKSMGISNGGFINEGNYADLVLIDLEAPNMQPENDIKKSLVYSADNSNVLMTIANGKIVYENGTYSIGEDEGYIRRKCAKIIERIKSEI